MMSQAGKTRVRRLAGNDSGSSEPTNEHGGNPSKWAQNLGKTQLTR